MVRLTTVPGKLDLLAAYDTQLRTTAETPSAVSVTRLGPLRLVTFRRGRGFVTYQDLGGADAGTIRAWIRQALAHYQADPAIRHLEWKTRGHDRAPGLHDGLLDHGFEAGEPESVMVGSARSLAVDVPLPSDVTLRQIDPILERRGFVAVTTTTPYTWRRHDGDPVSAGVDLAGEG